MAVKDQSTTEVDALSNTRSAKAGLRYPAFRESDYYPALINAMYHLDQASAGWLQVRPDDDSDTTIRVMPGRAVIGGSVVSYAGGTVDLAAQNNDTAYVWLAAGGVDSGADGSGWPSASHIKLAEVTLSAGAITALVDRRIDQMILPADELVIYTLTLTTQGSTAGASTITITATDRMGNAIAGTHHVRARVCDAAGYAAATNATIAAGANTTAVEALTANKDLVLQSHTDGTCTLTLTDATAETVTLRIGAPTLGGRRGDYTDTLDVTHA